MVEPITMIAISAGAVLIISSIMATIGIMLAPVVSSPADKYVHINYYDPPHDRIEEF